MEMAQSGGAVAKGRRTFRVVLNTLFSSPQAWLLLAQDRGYLDDAGIALELTPGEGAYTAAGRMAAEGFDLGYGDINALIELAAHRPDAAPVGIMMLFHASPSAIAVKADGPIRHPADLVGRTIIGHDTDVALRTFGAFCLSAGIDPSRVTSRAASGSLAELARSLLDTPDIDGMFGYVSTIRAALAALGVDADTILRFMPYANHAPALFGSCVMASRRLIENEPEPLAALVRALRRGVDDTLADPDAALDAVLRRRPDASRSAEALRLRTTLEIEMAALTRPGFTGGIDRAQLAASIDLVVRSQRLPRAPHPDEIFTDRFLPFT